MDIAARTPAGYEAVVGGDLDLAEFTELVIESQTAIDGSSPTTESFIRMMLGSPGVDQREGVLLLRSATSGSLAGLAVHQDPEPHIEPVINGWVHPEHTGRGLGSTIIAWGLDRARFRLSLAPENARVTCRCQASDRDTDAAGLFRDFGFDADRHDIEMELVLNEPVSASDAPSGVTVRTLSGADDIPIVARTIAGAFKDHYGNVETPWEETLGRWANYRAMDEWDDDLVFIAQVPDGAAGALVATRTFGSHTDIGYIGALGVLRPWRGKGLARALLTTAFAEYQRRGMRSVRLDVDADSLTGATRLYRSVGMSPVRSETSYLLELRPGIEMVKR